MLPSATSSSFLLVLATFFLGSCASPRQHVNDIVVVDGSISVRGHEPFTARILETPSGGLYVLVPGAGAPELPDAGMHRIRGTVYLDTWNGMPFAHLRVIEITPSAQ